MKPRGAAEIRQGDAADHQAGDDDDDGLEEIYYALKVDTIYDEKEKKFDKNYTVSFMNRNNKEAEQKADEIKKILSTYLKDIKQIDNDHMYLCVGSLIK
mgnify:CR=1 FL=1